MKIQHEQIEMMDVKTQQLKKPSRLSEDDLIQNDEDVGDLQSSVEDLDNRIR